MKIIRINDLANAEQLLYLHNREIGRTMPEEELRQGIRKFIQNGEVIGIVEKDRVIAMLNLYCNNYETLSGYICNVFVLEKYRGQHIARSLMEHAIAICKKRHFKNVRLHVALCNTPAVKTYQSLGFRYTGEQNAAGEEEMCKNFEETSAAPRRILVLGSGNAQLDLIREAKKLGYYVIVCDNRPEMAGSLLADRYYQHDYMDKDTVLQIAVREEINGIISNSEPVMPIVAEVSQALNLPGNTVDSVNKLISKSEFRALQNSIGVYAPQSYIVSSAGELLACAQRMKFPIIVKPTQCSGTRGTTRLDTFDTEKICEVYRICEEYSRNHAVSVEEYVVMPGLRVHECDVFVVGDKFLWDGMIWTDRAERAPMVPRTYSVPVVLPEKKQEKLQKTVEKIMKAAGIVLGQYNVEAYFTKEDELFVIEINPRQGGNYIPRLVRDYCGVNLTKLLVSTAVGDMRYWNELMCFQRERKYSVVHIVFSAADGVFESIYMDESLLPYFKWMELAKEKGEAVRKCSNAMDAIGFVGFEFETFEMQQQILQNIEQLVYPVVKQNV